MKIVKNILRLSSRLEGKGYFSLVLLSTIGLFFLLSSYFFDYNLNKIILLSLFILIFTLSLVNIIRRGKNSGLNILIIVLLFGSLPILIIGSAINVKINIFYITLLLIAYLLLLHESSQEVKSIRKITYILSVIFKGLIFNFLVLLLFPLHDPLDDGRERYTPQGISHRLMMDMKHGLDLFKLDNGTYPLQKEGLNALINNPNPKKYLNYASNAYMDKLPLDPWKNPFIYIHYQTDKGDKFQIISFGADGKYGGEGENADIVFPDCQK